MKRILALALALCLLFCAAACGKSGSEGAQASGSGSGEASGSGSGGGSGGSGSGSGGSGGSQSGGAGLTGTLRFLSESGASVLRGVSLYGNRSGSAEFNAKPMAAEGIRCVFELNEYVGGMPDTDADRVELYVLRHRDDQKSYESAAFSEETAGFAALCVMERGGDGSWGEFYLNPEDAEPGLYDFVFVIEGRAAAVLLTRFCAEGELEGKSDAELEALMKE